MNSLESRKRLLIAESELNRAQLRANLNALRSGLRTLSDGARSIGSIASSAAVLVAALAAVRRRKIGAAAPARSWYRTAIEVGGLISTLWLAFRAQGRERSDIYHQHRPPAG